MGQPQIELAAAIRQLRRELAAAMREGTDEELQFQLGPVELELELGVTRAAAGDAGVRFWVLSVGAKASEDVVRTHRLTLHLEPIGRGGQRIRLQDDAEGGEDE
jgi:hypothetical protein